MNTLDEDFRELLEDLGFTKYQSAIYTALALNGPLNAAETAKRSGVPRPKIYDNLEILRAKAALEVHESSPKRYSAIGLRELTEKISAEHASKITGLKERAGKLGNQLKNASSENHLKFFVWVRDNTGKAEAVRKATQHIKDAKKQVIVSTSKYPMTPELYRTLSQLTKKGLKVRVLGNTSEVKNNSKSIEAYKKAGCEVRSSLEECASFFSIDDDLVLMSADPEYNTLIRLVDTRLVKTFNTAFDTTWNGATPV